MTGNYDPGPTRFIGVPATLAIVRRSAAGRQFSSSSTLALDGEPARSRAISSTIRTKSWDSDEMNAPMLLDFQANGATTKGLLKPARSGYLYWLKRDTDGSIAYLRSQAFVPAMPSPASTRKPGGPKSTWRTSRALANRRSSAPAFGAARTGQ